MRDPSASFAARLVTRSTLVVSLAVAGAGCAASAGAKTIQVDCTKGKSIQAAVDDGTVPLVVEVHGFCTEHVVIRHELTLRGADPALDGIQGAPSLGSLFALVEVQDVRGRPAATPAPELQAVYLQNLGIRASPSTGFASLDSVVGMRNVAITDSVLDGAHFTTSSYALLEDATFADNGGNGVNVQRNASVACGGCHAVGNGNFGVRSTLAGNLSLFAGPSGPSTVSGARGGQVVNEGILQLDQGTQVSGTTRALLALRGGQLFAWSAEVDGPIWCGISSTVQALELHQTANGGQNVFYAACALEHDDETRLELAGATRFETHATAAVYGEAHFGDLACSGGGDVVCQGAVTAGSSSCGACQP